ncbi:hypothetical protein LR48_Vigan07g030700 [Vigna angularis]|uniref:Uncharacterized protein n=1 Tax=Phaseolus angularis TaxID=3914 RepID=A0A0L9UV25_PHAAN|nr:hypothetical protein LR48_Vigan07g030700 [Vigna angularis]
MPSAAQGRSSWKQMRTFVQDAQADARPEGRNGRSSLPGRKDARPSQAEEDARPESKRSGRSFGRRARSSSQARRSSSKERIGRSSRYQKWTFIQLERTLVTYERTLVQRANKRTLVQVKKTLVPKRTRSGRSARQKWTLVQTGSARPLSFPESFAPGRSLVLWRCDFTAGAHGGREELVGTSPPLPLGLLLLPSSMFVSFRVLHGNGEPNPSLLGLVVAFESCVIAE